MVALDNIKPGSPPLVTLLAAELASQLVGALGKAQACNIPPVADLQPSGFYDEVRANEVIGKAFCEVTGVAAFNPDCHAHRQLLRTARRYAVEAGMSFEYAPLLQRLWHSSVLLEPSITSDNWPEPDSRFSQTPWRSRKILTVWQRHAFHWCVLHPEDVVRMRSRHPVHTREWLARLRGDHVEFRLSRPEPASVEVYISHDCIGLHHVRTI